MTARNSEGTNFPSYCGEFGCCEDQKTKKVDTDGSNCTENNPQCGDFGCCYDQVTVKTDE